MSNEASYSVRVTKDHLVFSAAHFITFNGNICERLHGHNWRVAVEVTGPLDENRYVFDFIALRDATQKIVNRLDHRMLLPTLHKAIQVTEAANEVEVRFENRRWVFPAEDCLLLPVINTTAEEIACWIGNHLQEDVFAGETCNMETLCVEVEENFGQWAKCKIPISDSCS